MNPDIEERIASLIQLIQSNPDSRVMKRALAVKLVLEGYKYDAVRQILSVSCGFISKWKAAFESNGIEGLSLGYKGGKGYLSNEEVEEVVDWLISQQQWDISTLEVYLLEKYEVTFKSRQSYYHLINKARMNWQKMQQANRRKGQGNINKKNNNLDHILPINYQDINYQKLILYITDESYSLKSYHYHSWRYT